MCIRDRANTLRPQDADRLGISIQRCLENAQLLRANPQVREKVVAVYAEACLLYTSRCV